MATDTLSSVSLEKLQTQLIDSLKKTEQAQIEAYIALCQQKLSEYQKQKQKLELYLDRTNLEIKTMELSIKRLNRDLKITQLDPNTIFYVFPSDDLDNVPGFQRYGLDIRCPIDNIDSLQAYSYKIRYTSPDLSTESFLTHDQHLPFKPLVDLSIIRNLIQSQQKSIGNPAFDKILNSYIAKDFMNFSFIMYIPNHLVESRKLTSATPPRKNFFENYINFPHSKSLSNPTESLNDVD